MDCPVAAPSSGIEVALVCHVAFSVGDRPITDWLQGARRQGNTPWERRAQGSGLLSLRTDAAKRYKRVDRSIAVIWKMRMVVEQRFRRLNALELMKAVYIGENTKTG